MRYRSLGFASVIVLLAFSVLLAACGGSGAGDVGTALQVAPPPANLQIGGQQQMSGIGSYCWVEVLASDAAAVCADMVGIPTPNDPLHVQSPFVAHIGLAPVELPQELRLDVFPVSAEDELVPWPAGWRGWPFKSGEQYALPLERRPSAELSLEPGLYVLSLSARWQAWGDASYGFLVQVDPPALTVEETFVVPAGADGPGRFEYLDWIGEDVLARRRAWRDQPNEAWLARANAALAPFGYRLEPHFDAEWNTVFFDLYQDGEAKPLLPRLWHILRLSVNASGTEFALFAENTPNEFPTCLWVRSDGVRECDALADAFLGPVYAGDALASVTYTGFPTLTHQVRLDGQVVYTDTAEAQGAYFPLRSLSAWDGRWVLQVDDRLLVDGQDLAESMGYDAAYGFSMLHGQPFYFFEDNGAVHLSYAGQTLPQTYQQVVHDQCCEAGAFNVGSNEDMVWFHALRDGAWYYVEAGLYPAGDVQAPVRRYVAPEGWSFQVPDGWDRFDWEAGFVQESATGKTVVFSAAPTTRRELEGWIESEVARKVGATEADNALEEPVTVSSEQGLTVYRYAIRSRMEGSEALLRTTVLFDGSRRYEFLGTVPPLSEADYQAVVGSFRSPLGCGQAGSGPPAGVQPPFPPPDGDLRQARGALIAFFSLLHAGRHADAVSSYGGSYELLQGWNPTLSAADHAALLEQGCAVNGLQCFLVKRIVHQEQVSPEEFQFVVEFLTLDGELFVLGPCCGATETETLPQSQFAYTVVHREGRFLVQELPIYVP